MIKYRCRLGGNIMNNPYKIAGNILSGTSTFHDDFSSIDLYGAAVQKKNENAIC